MLMNHCRIKCKRKRNLELIKFSCFLRGSVWTWVLSKKGQTCIFPKRSEKPSVCQFHYYGLITFVLEACFSSPAFPGPTSTHLQALTTANKHSRSFKRTATRNRQPHAAQGNSTLELDVWTAVSLFQSTVTQLS